MKKKDSWLEREDKRLEKAKAAAMKLIDQLPKIVRDRLNRLAADMPKRPAAVLRMEARALSAVVEEMLKPEQALAARQRPAGKTLIEVFANEDATKEIERLRKLVDEQPHWKSCSFVLGQSDQCNCWKAEARR